MKKGEAPGVIEGKTFLKTPLLGRGARLRFFERESDDGFWWFSYWRWWGA